jgi:hypothetical protein
MRRIDKCRREIRFGKGQGKPTTTAGAQGFD